MRKMMVSFSVLIGILLMFSGCGQDSAEDQSMESNDLQTNITEHLGTSSASATMDAILYVPNEQVDGFDISKQTMDLMPQSVVNALIEQGALPEGSKVLRFHLYQDGDRRVIDLDMSKAYGEQVASTGTAGEYMLLGSLVNSMLTNYQANELHLTCEGDVLETGHNVYDMPLGFYENFDA